MIRIMMNWLSRRWCETAQFTQETFSWMTNWRNLLNNRELTSKEVVEIQSNYPPGTRILLNHMEEQWAVPPGTRGTVEYVDDAGQIHPKWDNGRTLAIVPQVDSFRKLTEQEILEEQQLKTQEQGEQQWQTM